MIIPFLNPLVTLAPEALTPTHLLCNYRVDPIGIDDAQPRLFWIVESSRRGLVQSAYQVQVASSKEKLRAGTYDLWDSGKVASQETTQIPYGGKALAASQTAFWKVTIWDGDGNRSISKPAMWEVGLPSSSDWHASWITLPQPSDEPLKIPSPYLRKEFSTDKPIESARAYVSAKGLYRFFIDGKAVGDRKITPDWTDYRKRIQYQSYDVTKLFAKGKAHAAGLVLGNGWFCGHVGGVGGKNYGTNPSGIVQLEIKFKDGTTQEVVSDGSWKGHTGAILSNDLQMGETEDARLTLAHWSEPGATDTDWVAPQTAELGSIPLVSQENPPVRIVGEIKPKKMLPQKQPNVYVYDLGQNMVGWARLKVNGSAGETVQLRFAEMLNPDGTIYTTNLRSAAATDRFTLTGKGTETFEPYFTTHGFRYVEVTGSPTKLGLDAITGVVVGSDNPQTGEFACSSALVNQLQHNILWGQKGNYLSIPTDCPQRDERLGWMGDAQIFVRTATYNNEVASFMTKWTQDVDDAQSTEGGFSDVSPRMGDPNDGAPAWGDAGVIVPFTIYNVYGDTDLLANRYSAMKAWVDYVDSANPDHLWTKRKNNDFGDWLNVQDETPKDVLATSYFAYSSELLGKAARALGKDDDAAKYETLHDEIVKAYDATYVDPTAKIQGDTQTAYVLALRFGLLPESQRAAAAKRLVDHIVIDRKNHLSTGFVGVGYLNPTLTAYGYPDVAYKLLMADTYPSWGYSIRQGATTIWERWDGWTTDKGFQDPGMNSFNHYSLGSVGEWMYRTVAGIDLDPSTPGFKKIVIHPIPGGGLTWARAKFDSIHGRIESSWKADPKEFLLAVTIPSNTTARIFVPKPKKSNDPILENGHVASENLRVEEDDPSSNYTVFDVSGGTYHFASHQ